MLSLITKFQRGGSHLLSRMSSLGLEPVSTCQGGDSLPSAPGQALKETRYASVIVIYLTWVKVSNALRWVAYLLYDLEILTLRKSL